MALGHPKNHDISLMLGLVNAAISAGISPEAARAGYLSAFEQVRPPPGIRRWNVKLPPQQHQQQQSSMTPSTAAEPDASSNKKTADFLRHGVPDVSSKDDTQHTQPHYFSGSNSSSSSSSSSNDTAFSSGELQSTAPEPNVPADGGASSFEAADAQGSSQGSAAAEQLLTYALLLLKASKRLAACGEDDNSMPQPLPLVPGGPPGGRLLLAAALQDNAEAMPNFVLQVLLVSGQHLPTCNICCCYCRCCCWTHCRLAFSLADRA